MKLNTCQKKVDISKDESRNRTSRHGLLGPTGADILRSVVDFVSICVILLVQVRQVEYITTILFIIVCMTLKGVI